MSIADSSIVFEGRMRELQLGDLIAAFKAKKWNSHSAFAFSSTYNPNLPTEDVFITKVVEPMTGSEDPACLPQLRRLFFESYNIVMADVRRSLGSLSWFWLLVCFYLCFLFRFVFDLVGWSSM